MAIIVLLDPDKNIRYTKFTPTDLIKLGPE